MLHHARQAAGPLISLSSVFQMAAGRAWVRRVHDQNVKQTRLNVPRGEPNATAGETQCRNIKHRETAEPGSSSHHASRISSTRRTPSPRARRTISTARSDVLVVSADKETPIPLPDDRWGVPYLFAVPVDPDTLQPHELESRDNDRISTPWNGTWYRQPDLQWLPFLSVRAARRLPRVHDGPYETQVPPVVREPTSRKALIQNLLHLMQSTTSPPPILRLIEYHNTVDYSLHSAKSFNLLVAWSLRNAAFKHVMPLFQQMVAQNVVENDESKKLFVRYLVRSRKWRVAWKMIDAALQRERRANGGLTPTDGGIPLNIWLEMFGAPKRGAFKRSHEQSQNSNPRRPLSNQLEAQSIDPIPLPDHVDAARHRLLMRHSPKSAPGDFTRSAARILNVVVDMLLRSGEEAAAFTLTHKYLLNLPPNLDRVWHKLCIRLINMHAAPRVGQPRLPALFSKKRRLVKELLTLHPQLTPNSTTLFRLLSNLTRSQFASSRAQQFIETYKRVWGMNVEDSRVRRRFASLALKEGRTRFAHTMIQRERIIRLRRARWAMLASVRGGQERVIAGHDDGPAHRKWVRWSSEHIYGHRGVEEWHWRKLLRRFRSKTPRGLSMNTFDSDTVE